MGEIVGRSLWTIGAIVGMYFVIIGAGAEAPRLWSVQFWLLVIGVSILANLLESMRYSRGTSR